MPPGDSPAADRLVVNGIDAASGTYLVRPLEPGEIVAAARQNYPEREHLRDLERRSRQTGAQVRGVKEGVDPVDLAQAGWGILFALQDQEQVPALKEALGELLALRRAQAGERYREFSGPEAYRPGETKTEFLARHGVGPGPADPDRVPYYLLIAGDPQAIPYTFQYQLDVQYAVGRIHFDRLEAYAQYARSVVAQESGAASAPRRASFFGVQNEDDQATQLSATRLVKPLADRLQELRSPAGWEVETVVGAGATKAALAGWLESKEPPALLFTASHGVAFPKDDPRQLPHQGALLCQDWPGPGEWRAPIPQDFYYSGEDVPSGARLSGRLAFLFACYGAGTPQLDDFPQPDARDPRPIAPHAFLAGLPQRLLSHPNGGMLAVIGHVERAWGYSFRWEKTESQLAAFESTLLRLLDGLPVGYAMEYFNQRYAELSTLLSSELQGARFGKLVDELELAGLWTANNDARSYVILGDPAARLVFAPLELHSGESARLADPASILVDQKPSGSDETPLTAIDRLTRQLLSTQAESSEPSHKPAQPSSEFLAKESHPFDWAIAHLALARLEIGLYRSNQNETCRRRAIDDLKAALEVFTPQDYPDQYAGAQELLSELSSEDGDRPDSA